MGYDLAVDAFREEADAGFPLLRVIPSSSVAAFLDHVATLSVHEQRRLVDALAYRAARLVGDDGPSDLAAFGSWLDCLAAQPDAVAEHPLALSYRAFTRAMSVHTEAPTPESASSTLLRKLVKAAMKAEGIAAVSFGGGLRFLSSDGTLLDVDFGSRMGQLCYGVSVGVRDPKTPLTLIRASLTYEGLWGLHRGWDRLTDVNAQQSVAALPRVVRKVAGIMRGKLS
jgi:hypothetical protein